MIKGNDLPPLAKGGIFMREIQTALSFNDVLLEPQYSDIDSRNEVELATTIAPGIRLNLPLITVNMDTVTGVDMAIAISRLGGIGLIGRFDTPDVQAEKIGRITQAGARCIGVIGVKGDELERAEKLVRAGSVALHLDIAHAHSRHAIAVIKACKNRWPEVPFIAGTIATYQAALDLYEAGADSLKVGIGGGSICITRVNAGSGVPQVTAIMACARAREEKYPDRFILADGGAANSGDIVKALAAGADAYMGGSLFAGTDEAPGEKISIDGRLYKEYNGSTSRAEKLRQLEKDAAGKHEKYAMHIEGVEAMVPYKGPLQDVVESLTAGIRSGLSYSGARSIKELQQKAKFIRITQAGFRESQAHDVILR
jgi:IMP dehydrogenase